MSALTAVASLPQTALNLIHSHTKSRFGAYTAAAPNGLKAAAATTSTSTTTAPSTAAQATTDIGTTFLSLLTKELQNQDPTAPMDSTAMVGQMISLNQLDQLIAINSALTPATTTATTTTPVTPVTSQVASDSASTLAAKQALLAGTQLSSASAASSFDPSATLTAAAQSASNAGALNLSNFTSMFGGK